jgi:hypothetical protein
MPTYTVAPGDCLASIAERFGFSDPMLIYNLPDNEVLRRARPDPNVLLPGDQVVVPERKPRIEELATEQRHRFVVKRPMTFLRLRLQAPDGKPRSGLPYEVAYLNTKLKGVTTAEGVIEQPVPRDLTLAVVTVGKGKSAEVFNVGLGFMDPVTSESGVRQRLGNLGLLRPIDGVTDDLVLRFAIHTFQLQQGLEPTGGVDTETRNKLLEVHGS